MRIAASRAHLGWNDPPLRVLDLLEGKPLLTDRDVRRDVRGGQNQCEVKGRAVVNAGYAAVKKAELGPRFAMKSNGLARRVRVEDAKRLGALLVHYSTDYAFKGA